MDVVRNAHPTLLMLVLIVSELMVKGLLTNSYKVLLFIDTLSLMDLTWPGQGYPTVELKVIQLHVLNVFHLIN